MVVAAVTGRIVPDPMMRGDPLFELLNAETHHALVLPYFAFGALSIVSFHGISFRWFKCLQRLYSFAVG